MEHLTSKLKTYSQEDIYPFHMPGHKRNPQMMDAGFPYAWDITEIDGFDNLHHPEGILKDVQKQVSQIYGTKESFYSVNGSTTALLSAVFAVVKAGGKLLVARNCHKSVYHAMYLRGIHPVYLYPQTEPEFRINGGILPEDVENALKAQAEDVKTGLGTQPEDVENALKAQAEDVKTGLGTQPEDVENALKRRTDIQAVLITSPTYDGVVSDVEKIAKIAHRYGVPLIVDEAHGAHFHFSDYFPASAADLGADLVVQSFHKTLPSMTQTAVLHRCSDRVDGSLLARYMGIFQSSSPSYVLMASIDSCMEKLAREGEELFRNYTKLLDGARKRLENCRHIRLITPEIVGRSGIYAFDRSKLLLSTEYASISGAELHEILLDQYHLQMEMAAENYVTALTSVGDTEEGFSRLCCAIQDIDKIETDKFRKNLKDGEEKISSPGIMREGYASSNFFHEPGITSVEDSRPYPLFMQRTTIAEAMDGESESVSWEDSIGRVSSEFAYLYPPGIPLIVPGEQISEELVRKIDALKRESLDLQGLMDYTGEMVRVLKESGKRNG